MTDQHLDQHQQPHSLHNNIVSPDSSTGTSSTPTHGPCKSLKIGMACAHGESNKHAVTLNILPDDIFLEIFAFCLVPDPDAHGKPIVRMRVWQRLAHVCQRWRQIIYASPHYLDLHLYCTHQTPFRKNPWPEFPLALHYFIPKDEDDLIAALRHHDRVCRVDLMITSSEVDNVVGATQVPFPVLTHLNLMGDEVDAPDLHGFLGGSAPCLQHLRLISISFPDLPRLLLSARDLISLQLHDIPATGCISPEAMVRGLAVLTRLRTLLIGFQQSVTDHSDQRRPDPPMLAVLPALTRFVFKGDSRYLEDLVAQIDAPRVDNVSIEYFMQEVQTQVQTRQFFQFIGRTENLSQLRQAQVTLGFYGADIKLDLPQGASECHRAHLSLKTLDSVSISAFSNVVHVLGQLVTMLSNVILLSVRQKAQDQAGRGMLESVDWLPLLRLFSAVEVLQVSGGLGGYIASALEDTTKEMVTVLLPALQLLWLDDDNENKQRYKPVGSTERFRSLRQLSGRPVTIVNTQDEFIEILKAHWRR